MFPKWGWVLVISFLVWGGKIEAQTVATPVLSPTSGQSAAQFNVTVTDSTSGATIRYTLDGSTPTISSSSVVSGGTVLISQSETLDVKAFKSGYTASAMASATYQITGQVEGGFSHTVSLRSDGTVWAWGLNSNNQLGDGTAMQRSSPVQVTTTSGAAVSGIMAVAAGNYHSLAVKGSDGSVWCWGLNVNGELGDGTTVQRSHPVQVLENLTNHPALTGVVEISAGAFHSLALKSDGTVWAWGSNSNGQLGDGTTTQRNYAVQVSGLSGVTVVEIVAGYYHNLALDSTGKVWAWGYNNNGQLGDGTTTDRTAPVAVSGLGASSGVVELAAGAYHSAALKSNGSVSAWGANADGQLGDGTTTQRTIPVSVSGLSSGVTELVAGGYHTLAIKSDGTAWAWGNNDYGELGNGNLLMSSTPVQMSGVSGAVTMGAGDSYSMVIKNDGTLWVCGRNEYGQIGDGISGDRTSAVQVSGLGTTVMVNGNGSYHGMALKNDATLWAFGNNTHGELGDGTTNEHLGPEQVLSGVASASSGQYHSLAIKSDGTLWAWGGNNNAQLGDGTTTNRTSPVQVTSLSSVTKAFAAFTYSLAIKSDGTLWSWGLNSNGQLGDGTTTNRTSPVQVTSLSGITSVSGGGSSSVALKSDGTVWAWGLNSNGQIGDGTTTQRTSPVQVTGLSGVIAVAAGQSHTLALKSDGTVWAWGLNANGQIGDGTTTQRTSPVQVTGLSGIVAISAGSNHSLALKNDGTVWAWGANGDGQLGNGATTQQVSPVQASGLSGVVAISAGGHSNIVLKEDGTVEAWGNDSFGQLGTGLNYSSPFAIAGFNLLAATPLPTVSITAPANNATIDLGQSQTLTASASETGGTIASVKYYIDSTLLNQSTSGTSYSVTWTPATWGNYIFTAIATDSNGNTSRRSSVVTVAVPYDSDNNGLPDWWELKYFGHLGNDPSSSPDGNSLTLLQDYQQGNDPTNYYSQGGTIITPVITIISGNNQTSTSGNFAPQPLVVKVTNSNGGATLFNAPVLFTADNNGGLLAPTILDTPGSPLQARTDTSGLAQVYFQQPSGNNISSAVSATTSGQSVSFAELTRNPAATPTFSPGAGTYTSSQTVTLSSSTSGATIYYTTDGSTPTTGSSSVSSGGTVAVTASETLKAMAVATVYSNSPVASAAYVIQVPAATPTSSPGAGTYTSSQTVTLSSTTSGATIYYTTDGTDPTTSSSSVASGGTITVAASETLKALAVASGYNNSAILTAAYVINSGPPPDFIVDPSGNSAGHYTTIQSAINALAHDNQVIAVMPGTYYESPDSETYKVTLRSTNGAASTIIDGGGPTGNGGLYAADDITIDGFTFTDSLFNAIYVSGSSSSIISCKIVNCVFYGNNTRGYGVIECWYTSLTVTNCTLFNNTLGGKPAIQTYASTAALLNTILWDGGNEIGVDGRTGQPSTTATYCDIQGSSDTTNGNKSSDPLLRNDGHLSFGSPCINMGTPAGAPNRDMDNEVRPSGSDDIGADEYIDTNGNGLPDSWQMRYFNHLGVDPGAFVPNGDGLSNHDNYQQQIDPITDTNGIAYAWEWQYFGALHIDPNADQDGDGYSNICEYTHGTDPTSASSVPTPDFVVDPSGNSLGHYTTIQSAINAVIRDYQVIAVMPGTYHESLDIETHKVMLRSTNGAASTIIDAGNNINNYVYVGLDAIIDGFTFTNSSQNSVYLESYLRGSNSSKIVDCVFYGNHTQSGVVQCWDANLAVTNCTLFNNILSGGPAIQINASFTSDGYTFASAVTLLNTILWDGGNEIATGGNTVTATYCDIQGSSVFVGQGNINSNPLFWPDGHLGMGSPCIGLGTPAGAPNRDMDNEARPSGSDDIGADEYIDTVNGLPNWWQMKYYNHLGVSPTGLALNGVPNLYDYQHLIEPFNLIDSNGIAYAWEWQYFAQTGIDPNAQSPSGSGVTNLQAYLYGYNPTMYSTNGDGLSDLVNYQIGIAGNNYYISSDGLTNAQNLALGIDPFNPNEAPVTPPAPDPSDHTAPVIILNQPANATLLP